MRGGILDYWGCPAPAANRVIAEVRVLIERGRRPRRPHVAADGGCLLCEAATGTPLLPLVAESAGAVGVLHVGEPSAAGHCVFFPLRHTPNLHDLDDAELKPTAATGLMVQPGLAAVDQTGLAERIRSRLAAPRSRSASPVTTHRELTRRPS